MTPETIAYAKDRIAYWQNRLRLDDWHINLSLDPPPANCRAHHDSHVNIRQSVIRLSPDVPWDQVEREVLHELLHIRFGIVTLSLGILSADTTKATDEAFSKMWDLGMEGAIEALCDAFGVNPRHEWDHPLTDKVWLNLA